METTLSIIKADVGSIGGHIAASAELIATIYGHVAHEADGLLSD
jgi:fructose 1,6-bisphosphate aldolase/phosphatase